MLGDYVVHFPVTDFATSLLFVAALVEIGRILFHRPGWSATVDILLVGGFLGALASVGSGLWLVASSDHAHDNLLSTHHVFAYGALSAATLSVVARLLQRRSSKLAVLKTAALVVAAGLVSVAGYYGGKMSHADKSHERDDHRMTARGDHR